MFKYFLQHLIVLIFIFIVTFLYGTILQDIYIQYLVGIVIVIVIFFLSFFLYLYKKGDILGFIFLFSYLYFIFNIFLINFEYSAGYYDINSDSLSLGYAEYFINSIILLIFSYLIYKVFSKNKFIIKLFNTIIKKALIFFIKLIGILFGFLTIFVGCWWIYANIFLTIDEERAWGIARDIINEKYEDKCHGGFQEKLTLQKNTYNAVYEFHTYSKNRECSVLIFMGKFGEYDSWIGVN